MRGDIVTNVVPFPTRQRVETDRRLHPGQRVRVTAGAYAGREARVMGINEAGAFAQVAVGGVILSTSIWHLEVLAEAAPGGVA
ncbi:KOW motif-containing protein [Zavarzinia aquatilis]|uniref:KOW domain-containing protein n=1 Tax=Zavarzinia aquatilis TaxID=2211142 RepID=A0A317EF93_9PROT|nr:KOW motif-containing protein [Zavarzinia aquatilis]PWR24956.1 hypothetical protein DKG74_04090 [Zavarzinia aquatilis]